MTNHWTKKQKDRLLKALKSNDTVAFVLTDQHGRPSNGGSGTTCKAGAVHKETGKLEGLCCQGVLHGTLEPKKWHGCRVWIAVFKAPVIKETDKLGSKRREIIGEVLPKEAMVWGVAVKTGRKDLSNADLSNADLSNADLSNADLRNADLRTRDTDNLKTRGAIL